MPSSTAVTQALCLLLLVSAVAGFGVASAERAKNNKMQRALPGSCLMAASTLCANADTNAMRCIRKLAIRGDARVPTTCAEAIMAGVTVNPRHHQARRAEQLARLLSEGGAPSCGANSCPSTGGSAAHNRCNDVQSQ